MPQSQKRRKDGERANIIMLGGYSMCFNKMLNNGEERWMCSRRTVGQDAAGETKYCQGSARKFPLEEALRLHTVHSPWCQPKQDDEEIRIFNDRLHHFAALDETLPASTVVDMAKYRINGRLRKRLPNDDSLIEKVNRRRNHGSLYNLNKAFHECELPLSFQRTIDGEPFLLLDYQGRVSGALALLTRYNLARDNTLPDGSAFPITTRSGRLRARQITELLHAACDEYNMLAKPRSAEQRQEHIESIGRILALYHHRRHFRPIRKDKKALTMEEVEAMELPTPGATEEDDEQEE